MQRPKFTKRHFEDIAGVLNATQPDGDEPDPLYWLWLRVREHFITLFESENPNFDRELFIKATEEL